MRIGRRLSGHDGWGGDGGRYDGRRHCLKTFGRYVVRDLGVAWAYWPVPLSDPTSAI